MRETTVTYFSWFPPFAAPFHLRPQAPAAARLSSSGPLSGRQKRMMGKWVLGVADLLHSGASPLSLSVAPVLSKPVLWFERRTSSGARSARTAGRPRGTWTGDNLKMGMRVCHHGDSQGDRHIHSLSRLLSPPPTPCPHTTLKKTRPHTLPLCVLAPA